MAERKCRVVRYPRGAGWLPIAPKGLPGFDLMFDDIGASPARLARHLGCDRTTVYRWLDGEPFQRRAYQLAMFYETQWGRSFVASTVESDARLYASQMVFLRGEVERLSGLLRSLGSIGDFGSANDPSPEVPASYRHSEARVCLAEVEALRAAALRRSVA